jgi:[acyl-carrier-protein] S-malonyltransferase
MQEAVPAGEGAMSAVLGLDALKVEEACGRAAADTGQTCSAANFNSPEQTVIAGTAAAVARAAEVLKEMGAKKVMPLAVSAPFHCELMRPAEVALSPFVAQTPFSSMAFPVVTNVDAQPNGDTEEARAALLRQIVAPVRWVESVKTLATLADRAIECGPGSVLAGLGKRIAKEWPIRSTSDVAGVEAVIASLSA